MQTTHNDIGVFEPRSLGVSLTPQASGQGGTVLTIYIGTVRVNIFDCPNEMVESLYTQLGQIVTDLTQGVGK